MRRLKLQNLSIALLFVFSTCANAGTELLPVSTLTVKAPISYLKRPPSDVDRFANFGFGALWFVVPPNLMRLDPADNSVAEIELQEAMTPGFVGIGEGAVWVTDIASELIFKVDPEKKQVVQTIEATGLYRDSMIALGDGSLWVVTGGAAKRLSRYDASSGQRTARIDLPSGCGPGAFYSFGSVWAVGEEKRELYRIDPASNSVVATIPLHDEPFSASVNSSSIWINNRKSRVVDRIDGATGAVVGDD